MPKFLLKLVAEDVTGTFALIGVYAVTFSPDQITAMAIAVSALVAAVGTVIVNIITARRLTAKVEEVKAEIKPIAKSVDGAATASAADNKALQKEVADLRALLAGSDQRAALLAQSAATGVAAKEKT